jgi:hypothetical protein
MIIAFGEYLTILGTIALKISALLFIRSILVLPSFCPLPAVITTRSEFAVSE